jgi:Winged helix DNA-binding domain
VRVPPSGTWERRRADLYAAAEDWVGPPPEIDDPAEHLVRRYLAGFGPAARKDVASFTGLPPARLRTLLDRLELRRFESEGGEELLDLPRAPLPDPDTPAPPRFLPTWDATLLVHARRTGLLPEEHRLRIFSIRTPHSFPTFLVDGRVAGTWKHERGAIRLAPFGRLDAAARRELEQEADRLAEFHA